MCDECAKEESGRLQRMPLAKAPAPPRSAAASGSLAERSDASDRQRQNDEMLRTETAAGAVPDMPPDVEAGIHALQRGGEPLPSAERAFFEPRFGHDFKEVRLHSGAQAARSAQAVQARAFTVGTHIVFGSGQFVAGTQTGRRLLAHELTHVVQQGGGGAPALQRQQIQPTCNGIAYDPKQQCCCNYRVIPGPCAAGSAGCADRTTRDNEYEGCSVPAWLEDPEFKDNPGLASDTWFSDRKIHGTKVQDSFDPKLPCDVHDKCYQTCSSNPTRDWEACDQQLFADADAVCEKHKLAQGDDHNYALCKDAVLKAEALLPRGSWGSFEERQRDYCACCPPPAAHDDVPIYFDSGSAELDAAAKAVLTAFVDRHRTLLESGAFTLDLIGNASRLGSDEDNLKLSQRRIAAVRAGIEDRLKPKPLSHVNEVSLGEKEAEKEVRPDEDDSRENRRVDVQISTTP
jgi:outer membrane protein OmpA-like peptidoglycan-associated protein